jgi:O-antigen/teichoic acid export membrane protein
MNKLYVTALKPSAPPLKNAGTAMAEDYSGRDRLVGSLASGWISQALQLVSGFVLPRLISDRLGQGSLGVWDFGWAVVSYFALLQGGIASSVNRYVARHRASRDTVGLNTAVNSVGLVLKGLALVIAALTCVMAWIVPEFMGSKLDGLRAEACWVVLFLGMTIAVQVQGSVYGGVLTGCHRWSIQNGIKTISTILSVGGGIVVIGCGGGIQWLAAIMLLSEIVTRSAQRIAARRVCPELEVSLRYFSRPVAREMVGFGGKGYVNVIAQMLVNQTSSVLVASTFGVGALAVFTRPRSLVRSLSSVIQSNAMVMVPMIGAMEAAGKVAEIRQLAISASRYAAFFCLPVMIVLCILGSDIVRLWMGDAYADQTLITLFALSGMAEASCLPLYRVLMGLNRHGRLAFMNVSAAVVTVIGTSALLLIFQADLKWVAVVVAIPSLIVNAFILPRYAAHVLDMRFGSLLWSVWSKPLFCCLPGAIGFFVVAMLSPDPGLKRLVMAGTVAVLGSGLFYWKHAVPISIRKKAGCLMKRHKIGANAA